ncbi:GNAT family N-acetyltransferase [Rhodanobacter hydrolyticus]|uniref:GNAT family N-acetyltransferase n=1 Tax=Rhodanobacter hydrolyticus TaxID=2250595 RepID=A0ABW8J783_9GAMM
MAVSIRPFEASDWSLLWPLLHAVFAVGDTYTFPPDASEDEIFALWIKLPQATFVACDESGAIVGSYYIKPNQPGHGSHVCNCGYLVAKAARGQGIASLMCEHSQATALALGFLAMQFNFVVSTNRSAVRLWQKHGFNIVGTLPKAFRHPQAGLVDAHVMYKWLAGGSDAP